MDAASPSAQSLQRFLETEDLFLLEKPLIFEKKNSFKYLQCCYGSLLCLATSGLSAFWLPIGTFCPCITFKHFSLRLDADSVELKSAANDCCCHVAESTKSVPLEKITDVELQESCLHTCFGLKSINVQTAGSGMPTAEVSAGFLQAPDQARQAISLAAKLHRQRMPYGASAPPPAQQNGMQRGLNAAQLSTRLQALEQLVVKCALTREEAAALKVPVLAAEQDPLQRLAEAKDLQDRGLLTAAEYASLKAALVKSIMQG
ncbi:hypothetical protein OEZ86_009535 [Tetradesmus obliquus]|uniref:YdbS-like PH domain-containing protein n=1 Tax=Tetradesmus obliquus TaxID=3088 RepID=A0ABY8UQH9_TETOB|nr:hypothetical protein OEZ85_000981 [Tetradesmus obliquus]WIA43000.1 hypothetical protein OEZ86_009535 [Tetradesmus obliquus]